jgi:hypothetical protein
LTASISIQVERYYEFPNSRTNQVQAPSYAYSSNNVIVPKVPSRLLEG